MRYLNVLPPYERLTSRFPNAARFVDLLERGITIRLQRPLGTSSGALLDVLPCDPACKRTVPLSRETAG
jgi:hypothetical protein